MTALSTDALLALEQRWRALLASPAFRSGSLAGVQELLDETPVDFVLLGGLPLTWWLVSREETPVLSLMKKRGWTLLVNQGTSQALCDEAPRPLENPLRLAAGKLGNKQLFELLWSTLDSTHPKAAELQAQALMAAAEHNHPDLAQLMMARVVTSQDADQWALGKAIFAARTPEMVDVLMKGRSYGASSDVLFQLARGGKPLFLMETLWERYGAPLDIPAEKQPDHVRQTLLHVACRRKDAVVANWVLDKGADPNARHYMRTGGYGKPIVEHHLHPIQSLLFREEREQAAHADQVLPLLEILKKRGVDFLNPHPKTGMALVHELPSWSWGGAWSFFLDLLDDPVLVEARTDAGSTLFHLVCQTTPSNLLQSALERLVSTAGPHAANQTNDQGQTPFLLLVSRLRKAADVSSEEVQDNLGNAVIWLMEHAHVDLFARLPPRESTADAGGEQGKTTPGKTAFEVLGWRPRGAAPSTKWSQRPIFKTLFQVMKARFERQSMEQKLAAGQDSTEEGLPGGGRRRL